MQTLGLSVDEVLTTTRSVRKRLDVTRPVSRAVIEECLQIAMQAPNGGNRNHWRWIIIDDPQTVHAVGRHYREIFETGETYRTSSPIPDSVQRSEEIMDSVHVLARNMEKMPALLIPLMPGRADGASARLQSNMWGSIVQSVWSFFLALRERGLGSCWTTVSLEREEVIADILGIPFDDYTQVGLFPIAYTIGTDFKPAWRGPLDDVLSYNRFDG